MRAILYSALLALGMIAGAQATQVTWTLTGNASLLSVSGAGAYANFPGLPVEGAAANQNYTLEFTFEPGGPGLHGSCGGGGSFCSYFNAGETATVKYGAYTFMIGPTIVLGPESFTDRRSNHRPSVDGVPGHNDSELIETMEDFTVGHGGNATTDLPGATHLEFGLLLENHNNAFLGFPAFWPDTLGNLNDFWYRSFTVNVRGTNSADLFSIWWAPSAFSTFSSSADAPPTATPVPGMVGLMVLALIGVGATGRRKPSI